MAYRTEAGSKATAGGVPVFCAHDKIVDIAQVKPNPRNPNTHPEEQVELLARIITQAGWRAPITVSTASGYVVKGHGRLAAARRAGLCKVPVDYQDYASEAEEYADLIADNRIAELAELDKRQLAEIFAEVDMDDIPTELTGYTDEALAELNDSLAEAVSKGEDWFENRKRCDNDNSKESQEYQEFTEKFETKKTTDDCYTPDVVYDAVADWVVEEYGLEREHFVRPFYPGGDYQKQRYGKSAVVVDNPPFSIFSEIVSFYTDKGIRFFLWAPALTIINYIDKATAIALQASVMYENGAKVPTSFVTNLEPGDVAIRTAPDLYQVIMAADAKFREEITRSIPRYSYPDEVVTSAMMGKWSKYGIEQSFTRSESVIIDALDSQKEKGKAIYGHGLLLSKRAAAERAAAERWELSARERKIVDSLGRKK